MIFVDKKIMMTKYYVGKPYTIVVGKPEGKISL